MKTASEWLTKLFVSAIIFVVILLAQALLLTSLNQLKLVFLIISSFVSILLSILFLYFIKLDIKKLPHLTLPALFIILLISLILIFFPHDTFGGRDEGVYSGLAVYLATHANLHLPSYLETTSMRAGDAKNLFPAYIVWLAMQKIFLGINWMLRSNVLLIGLGLSSFFLVTNLLGGKKVALISLFLYASCMPFLWFSRETMTENLAFFLLWALILFLFLLLKTKRSIYLFATLICSWLFSATRVEGFLAQFFLIFALLFISATTKTIALKKVSLVILIYFCLVTPYFYLNRTSYQANLKDTIPILKILIKKNLPPISSGGTIIKNKDVTAETIKLGDRIPNFIFNMLAKYNLALALFSIFLLIPIVVFKKKLGPNKNIYFLSLLIVISPELYKFIDPRVTLEQPWLYRRYLYALLPAGYLSLSSILNNLVGRKLLTLLSVSLLIVNIVFSSEIISLRNNWPISEELEKLARNLSPSDFVIIKDEFILNYYYPITFLTYRQSIRSEFPSRYENSDLIPKEKKFKGIPYEKLFLLSDKELEQYQNFRLKMIDSANIKAMQLKQNCELRPLRDQLEIMAHNDYVLPYSEAIGYCSKTDNEIIEVKKKLFLYELIYEHNINNL